MKLIDFVVFGVIVLFLIFAFRSFFVKNLRCKSCKKRKMCKNVERK